VVLCVIKAEKGYTENNEEFTDLPAGRQGSTEEIR
jgi:hypothetical protein